MLAGSRPSEAVSIFTSFPAAGQVTSVDMQHLLTRALEHATHVLRDAVGSCDIFNEALKLSRAKEKQQRWLDVVHQLLSMRAAQTMPAGALAPLLQCSVAHGVLAATEALLALPAAQQLGSAVVEQLLSECLALNTEQFANRHAARRLLAELLVQQPAAARLDAPAVSRLLLRYGAVAAARGRAVQPPDRLLGAAECVTSVTDAYDAGGVLAGLLVGLPGVRQCDTAGAALLLSAAVQARVHPHVLELLLQAPAAAALSAAQLKKLLSVCAQHCYGKAFSLVLQHPAAPACTDAQVQLYASLMETLSPSSPPLHNGVP